MGLEVLFLVVSDLKNVILTISEKTKPFFHIPVGSQEGEGADKGHVWPRLGALW